MLTSSYEINFDLFIAFCENVSTKIERGIIYGIG